jgi:hypothetical protein
MSTNPNNLEWEISITLGDFADDYDIPGIAADLRARGVTRVDDVDAVTYRAILKRHDRTEETP